MQKTILCLDLGNTDLKYGLWRKNAWEPLDRLAWKEQPPMAWAELAQIARSLQPACIVLCSVVPSQIQAVLAALDGFVVDILKPVSGQINLGNYSPEQLGTDRWVKLVAARQQWPGDGLIVIGMGTSTTIDVLNPGGDFMGGAIVPGLQAFSQWLTASTDRLPAFDIPGEALSLPGNTTTDCMAVGLALGYPAMLRTIVRCWQCSVVPDARVIITGGLADAFLSLCEDHSWIIEVDPMLTMNGILNVYQHRDLV